MKEELKRKSEKIGFESKDRNKKLNERNEEEKKNEEIQIESNSDSNKSNGQFKNPSSHITSSSVSTSKEMTYMTPKSMHNLNLLFTQSNGKKTQNQRRIMNTTHSDFSPEEKNFINYTFNIPMSPIDTLKMNMELSNSKIIPNNENVFDESYNNNIQHMNINMRNNHLQIPSVDYLNSGATNIPQYIFNNNEGIMSINIEHKHTYDSRTIYEYNKKVNRKIEFTENEINAAPISSTMIKNQNSILSQNLGNLKNLKAISSRNAFNDSKEKCKIIVIYVCLVSSEDISAEEINSDSENLVKPQPIPGHNFSNLNSNRLNSNRIYLNPYSQFPENSLNIISNNPYKDCIKSEFNRGFKMDPTEYQIKLEIELEKKTQSCNCKKTRCLKLYCACFANGEYCINCNCTDCSNVIGNEFEKEEAFKLIKDKNPVALKLNTTKEEEIENANNETKVGCNCTKSNCSKKYCECYKANVKCSEICRCRDCGNASERLKHARNSFNAYLNKGKEFSINNSNIDANDYYNYDQFSIEKISVLIENRKLHVHKKSFKDSDKLIFLKEKNYLGSRHETFDEIGKLSENRKQIPAVCIIRKNDSFILEISKSILNSDEIEVNYLVQTPNLNKFRKRNRNSSLDSSNSQYNINNISEYNRLARTACETNKKIETIAKIPKGISKKLILDDNERIHNE